LKLSLPEIISPSTSLPLHVMAAAPGKKKKKKEEHQYDKLMEMFKDSGSLPPKKKTKSNGQKKMDDLVRLFTKSSSSSSTLPGDMQASTTTKAATSSSSVKAGATKKKKKSDSKIEYTDLIKMFTHSTVRANGEDIQVASLAKKRRKGGSSEEPREHLPPRQQPHDDDEHSTGHYAFINSCDLMEPQGGKSDVIVASLLGSVHLNDSAGTAQGNTQRSTQKSDRRASKSSKSLVFQHVRVPKLRSAIAQRRETFLQATGFFQRSQPSSIVRSIVLRDDMPSAVRDSFLLKCPAPRDFEVLRVTHKRDGRMVVADGRNRASGAPCVLIGWAHTTEASLEEACLEEVRQRFNGSSTPSSTPSSSSRKKGIPSTIVVPQRVAGSLNWFVVEQTQSLVAMLEASTPPKGVSASPRAASQHQNLHAIAANALPLVFPMLLEGLEALHEKGLVHGALTPGCLGVSRKGEVRLVVWNASRRSSPPWLWSAPEVLLAGQHASRGTDMWSAGAIGVWSIIAARNVQRHIVAAAVAAASSAITAAASALTLAADMSLGIECGSTPPNRGVVRQWWEVWGMFHSSLRHPFDARRLLASQGSTGKRRLARGFNATRDSSEDQEMAIWHHWTERALHVITAAAAATVTGAASTDGDAKKKKKKACKSESDAMEISDNRHDCDARSNKRMMSESPYGRGTSFSHASGGAVTDPLRLVMHMWDEMGYRQPPRFNNQDPVLKVVTDSPVAEAVLPLLSMDPAARCETQQILQTWFRQEAW
jgi:serine/threonine protein kinase